MCLNIYFASSKESWIYTIFYILKTVCGYPSWFWRHIPISERSHIFGKVDLAPAWVWCHKNKMFSSLFSKIFGSTGLSQTMPSDVQTKKKQSSDFNSLTIQAPIPSIMKDLCMFSHCWLSLKLFDCRPLNYWKLIKLLHHGDNPVTSALGYWFN